MPFGKHIGKPLSELPNSYLEWFCSWEAGSDEMKEAMHEVMISRLKTKTGKKRRYDARTTR